MSLSTSVRGKTFVLYDEISITVFYTKTAVDEQDTFSF